MTFMLSTPTVSAFALGVLTTLLAMLFTYIVRSLGERAALFAAFVPFSVTWVILFIFAFGGHP